MVLAELGLKLKEAFTKLNKAEFVDKKLVDEILNTVGMALIKSDVKIAFVSKLQRMLGINLLKWRIKLEIRDLLFKELL